MNFFHVGLTVSDMARSLAFYGDGLGFGLVSDTTFEGDEMAALTDVIGVVAEEARVVFLSIPGPAGASLELFAYRGVEQLPAAARPWDFGASHMCIYTDDAEAVCARACSFGGSTRMPLRTVATGPHAGTKAVYLLDPDGYPVELYQAPPVRN
jgi:lactoylglutathione lyase